MVSLANRVGALVLLFAITACSAPAGTAGSATITPAAPRMHPNEGAGALPGEGANALPGAILPCTFDPTAGQANCTIAVNTRIASNPNPSTPSSLVPGYHPADLQAAYGMPSGRAGMTVAIVDAYDDPTAEADLAVYRTTFGLPACASNSGCFRKVNQSGAASAYPAFSTAWASEIALDVDMVSAICPNCKILLVEANSSSFDDLGKAADRAVAMGAKIVSNSYYGFEWAGETNEDAHYHHNGVAMTVAAGDAAEPFYPAASPYVLSVGGTTVATNSSGWKQAPWKFSATGCSKYEKKPAFQSNYNTGCKTRSVVDVAAIADPQTGVATFGTAAGGWIVAGGTSVGAPLLAAAYALSGSPQPPAYSYAHHASGFRDIAPAGYDRLTGLGTPYGVSGL